MDNPNDKWPPSVSYPLIHRAITGQTRSAPPGLQKQSSFSGMEMEFAPGVVRGVRGWTLGPAGYILRGVSYPMPWNQGENVAKCHSLISIDQYVQGDVPFGSGHNHRAPDPVCSCGFWAYFGPIGPRLPGFFTGVIEAYGKVLIGSMGFRAEKARIVALCPQVGELSWPGTVMRVKHRYPRIPMFPNYKAMIAEFPPDRAEDFGDGKKPEGGNT